MKKLGCLLRENVVSLKNIEKLEMSIPTARGTPDIGHGHIGHPASGHLTSDIWTYDTGEGKWTLDTWTLDTWTLDTCIFIFPHAYEHNSRSNYINKILL